MAERIVIIQDAAVWPEARLDDPAPRPRGAPLWRTSSLELTRRKATRVIGRPGSPLWLLQSRTAAVAAPVRPPAARADAGPLLTWVFTSALPVILNGVDRKIPLGLGSRGRRFHPTPLAAVIAAVALLGVFTLALSQRPVSAVDASTSARTSTWLFSSAR